MPQHEMSLLRSATAILGCGEPYQLIPFENKYKIGKCAWI